MVDDKNGETPGVIPQDVIPCLRGVYCDSDFLYFCVLTGRRIEYINLVGCDISLTIINGADLDALAEPMALARSLSVDGRMDLQCTLREDDIAPYSHLEFLAVAICDKITIGDVQMMAERWSKKLLYISLQCSGCIPGHDATAEAFFAAMPSLGILDIEIERKSGSNSASPRWSRYFRGSPMEKDTAIDFGFPSCDDFQDPLWVDNVEYLRASIEGHRWRAAAPSLMREVIRSMLCIVRVEPFRSVYSGFPYLLSTPIRLLGLART